MPDTRTHRGPHPKDGELFAEDRVPVLRAAVADFSLLLSRQYPRDATLKLVGDRYRLTARQRIAVGRCACSDQERDERERRRVGPEQIGATTLWIDGFNVITSLESALGGGLLLRGRDGCTRDMASMHGSYRMMADTEQALTLICGALVDLGPAEVIWLLDQPVSNSGRLRNVLAGIADRIGVPTRIELVPDPDPLLVQAGAGAVVATADSGILDLCGPWFDLMGHLLGNCPELNDAWLVNAADE